MSLSYKILNPLSTGIPMTNILFLMRLWKLVGVGLQGKFSRKFNTI